MSKFTLTRQEAIALCTSLGFKTASKWNKDRMLRKLSDLSELVKDGDIQVDEEGDDADRMNEILSAIAEADGDVDISSKVEEKESEEEETNIAEPVQEKKPAKKTKKEKPVEKAEEIEVVEEKKSAEKMKKEKPAEKTKKEKPAEKNGSGMARIRPVKNRRFMAGVVLRDHGLQDGLTDELISRVCKMFGDDNKEASAKQLADAWHVLNGYLNG